jgi:hypothetical protein
MKKLFVIILALSVGFGCTGDKSIRIDLQEGQRLQDTKPGWWIKRLSIRYPENSYSLLMLIHKRLMEGGRVEYSYRDKDNKLVRHVNYVGIKLKETIISHGGEEGGISIYYNYKLPSNVLFTELIGPEAIKLKPGEYKGGVVYIHSKTDNARLVLYGDGVYCNEMMLF